MQRAEPHQRPPAAAPPQPAPLRLPRAVLLPAAALLLAAFLPAPAPAYAGGQQANETTDDNTAEPADPFATTADNSELTVDQAVDRALRNADAARRGRLEVRRSAAVYRAARAERFPRLSLSLSGSYLTHPDQTITIDEGSIDTIQEGALSPIPENDEPILVPGEPFPIPPTDLDVDLDLPHTVYRATATLEQPLFTWGQIARSVDAARLDREVQRAELEEIETEIRRDVRELYFGAVFGREAKALLAEMERVMEEIVRDREASYEQGTITREAVLEAEAQHAEVRASLAEARESTEDAREALAFYTRGGRPELAGLSSTFRDSVPTLDESSLVERARSTSPRRESLALQRRQAEAAAAAERGDRPLLPQLGLEVSLEADTDKFPLLEDGWRDASDYNVIISIGSDITLFDAGRRRWSIEEAEERARIARSGLEELDEGLSLEVRRAVGSLRRAEATLARRRAESAHAAERYANARTAYENEAITREAERLARLGELEAEAGLLEAKYELERALTRLEYTIAGSIDSG